MFSPISSPVPFYLGNSHPSPLPKAGGYKYSSPMAKLLTTPRSYLRLPHVNPLSQRIGITGQVTGNSLPGMTALTSMTKLSRSVEEASANSKPWVQWRNNHNPRSEFLTSVMGPGFTQSNPAADPVKEMYEAMEYQVRNKGMFTPVYNDNPNVQAVIGEYDSWTRLYPH